MDTPSTPTSIARRLVPAFAVVASMVLVPACAKPPTQIVLVVDTNLGKAELDEVKITVGLAADQVDGSATDAAAETDAGQPIDTSLTDGVHSFPLTLGIVPSGPPGSLQVSVQGLLAGNVVLQQTIVTSFVPGQPKLLEVKLLDTCVGIACAEPTTSLTCKEGMCQPRAVDGSMLPSWTGDLPPPPAPSATTPIGGRTIWANGWHTCAVAGARLYCWGRNSDGEIGDGMATNAKIAIPVYTSDLTAVGLGQKTTCVCDHAGQAWCWGRNVEAELGIGSASPSSPVPVAVPGLDDCVQIAGGAFHTCAVHRDKTVSCWGGNSEGQVGQPVSTTVSCPGSAGMNAACIKSPMLVPGLKDVAEVHAGESYTCARKADMTVWCWGSNFNGTLGDGTNTSRSTPAAVVNLDKDVAEIATGRWFACARHAGGTVSCWGQNDSGQLGNQTTGDMNKPVAVLGIDDAAQLGAGERHACVLRASGSVACWGLNTNGQLGNGTLINSPMPQNVPKLSATSIALGVIHTCAVPSAGSPVCWGANDAVEIGDGDATKTPRPLPASVAGFM